MVHDREGVLVVSGPKQSWRLMVWKNATRRKKEGEWEDEWLLKEVLSRLNKENGKKIDKTRRTSSVPVVVLTLQRGDGWQSGGCWVVWL